RDDPVFDVFQFGGGTNRIEMLGDDLFRLELLIFRTHERCDGNGGHKRQYRARNGYRRFDLHHDGAPFFSPQCTRLAHSGNFEIIGWRDVEVAAESVDRRQRRLPPTSQSTCRPIDETRSTAARTLKS